MDSQARRPDPSIRKAGKRRNAWLAGLAALTIGCVSNAPIAPTAATASLRSIDPTLPAPTTSGSPSASASQAPSFRPTPSASRGPDPTILFGPFLQVLADDLANPRSGFATGDFLNERVAYEDGALVLQLKSAARSTWSMREFGDWPLVEVGATMTPLDEAGEGFFGLACGASNEQFYAALVTTSGAALLLRVAGSQAVPLAEEPAAIPAPVRGQPLELGLTCVGAEAGTQPGLALEVDGLAVLGAVDPTGLGSFRRGGFYAESMSASDGFAVAAEEIVVNAGLRAEPLPVASPSASASFTGNAAADALALHVPADLRSACRLTSVADPAVSVAIDCATDTTVTALYLQFADVELMREAYDEIMAAHPEARGASCQFAAGEGPYTVDGVDVGRLICFQESGVARLAWTDERLLILADATWRTDSFEELYAWWEGAGPVP